MRKMLAIALLGVLTGVLTVGLMATAADAGGRGHHGHRGHHHFRGGPRVVFGFGFYGHPYPYPYYYPGPYYYYPPAVVYSAPPVVYTAPPPEATAAPIQREVVYPHGKYVLEGDGVTTPYTWVWVANTQTPTEAPKSETPPATAEPGPPPAR